MNDTTKDFSRRTFVSAASIAALGAAALGLSGCAKPSSSGTSASYSLAATDTGTWDAEADIIIVGGGGAGLAAAVTAGEGGASVIVLEAAQKVGGNTANSSGVIQAAGTSQQKELTGVTDDTPEKHAEYYLACGEGSLDEDLVRYACEQAPSCIEWMESLGIKYEVVYGNGPIPIVNTDFVRPRIHLAGSSDNDLMYGAWHVDALNTAAVAAGVEFVLGTAATQLVQNAEGVITGVIAGDKRYKGRKGVILATCSFDRNLEMAKTFSQHIQWALEDGRAITVATNNGDGIRMGLSVGADLATLGGFIGLPNNVGGTPNLPIIPEVPGILVNKYGRRFVAESDHYAWVLRLAFAQEDHLSWGIWDATTAALGGPIVGGVSPMSDDFSKEIADGTVFVSDTVEGLAEQIGVPAANLKTALDTWNNDMLTTKIDSQFPTKSAGLVPINTPPYYATKTYDYNLGAIGGLKINTEARVINVNGDPIPHLFAGGQVAGGFMGSFYPGTGTGILSTLVFGRAAAQSALAEEAI
ncbi:MAG: FAD-dependent oxidoreductase [Actinobacteria bacterium]|nr:FAD-dependent oxidoreductase [Actinomycetota bacterium]